MSHKRAYVSANRCARTKPNLIVITIIIIVSMALKGAKAEGRVTQLVVLGEAKHNVVIIKFVYCVCVCVWAARGGGEEERTSERGRGAIVWNH